MSEEYIDLAAGRAVKGNYSTEYATIIELARKVRDLESRIEALEARLILGTH